MNTSKQGQHKVKISTQNQLNSSIMLWSSMTRMNELQLLNSLEILRKEINKKFKRLLKVHIKGNERRNDLQEGYQMKKMGEQMRRMRIRNSREFKKQFSYCKRITKSISIVMKKRRQMGENNRRNIEENIIKMKKKYQKMLKTKRLNLERLRCC